MINLKYYVTKSKFPPSNSFCMASLEAAEHETFSHMSRTFYWKAVDVLWYQDFYSGDKKALPGDPPSFHEAGGIPSSLPDGWVAAWAAPSSAVGVGAVGAVLFSAWQTVGRQSGSSKKNLDGESFVPPGLLGLTWRRSVYCAGTWPCRCPCLWRPSARTSGRCSRSCCAAGGWLCSETRRSSYLTRVSGVPETPTGSCDAPDLD